MSDSLAVWAALLPPLAGVFFLGLCMPALVRKELVFGVRISRRFLDDSQVALFYSLYRRWYLSASIPVLAACLAAMASGAMVGGYAVGIYLLLAVMLGAYWLVRKRVLSWKQGLPVLRGSRSARAADLDLSTESLTVSFWWFAFPLALVAANLALCLAFYDTLPEQIPMHWNLQGEVDRWVNKSWGAVLLMPMAQAGMTALMAFVVWIIKTAKHQISVEAPKASVLREREMRRTISAMVVALNVLLLSLFSFINLHVLGLWGDGGRAMLWATGVFTLSVFGGVAWMAVRVSRLSKKAAKEKADSDYLLDADDDAYWKWGLFYYNPQDPAMWVEKRFGLGYTVNFGSRPAVAVFAGVMALIGLMAILGIWVTK